MGLKNIPIIILASFFWAMGSPLVLAYLTSGMTSLTDSKNYTKGVVTWMTVLSAIFLVASISLGVVIHVEYANSALGVVMYLWAFLFFFLFAGLLFTGIRPDWAASKGEPTRIDRPTFRGMVIFFLSVMVLVNFTVLWISNYGTRSDAETLGFIHAPDGYVRTDNQTTVLLNMVNHISLVQVVTFIVGVVGVIGIAASKKMNSGVFNFMMGFEWALYIYIGVLYFMLQQFVNTDAGKDMSLDGANMWVSFAFAITIGVFAILVAVFYKLGTSASFKRQYTLSVFPYLAEAYNKAADVDGEGGYTKVSPGNNARNFQVMPVDSNGKAGSSSNLTGSLNLSGW